MNSDDILKNQGGNLPKGMEPEDLLRSPSKPLDEGFDPTAELVDRMIDDIIEKGAPCMDSITELVGQASYTDPKGKTREKE